MSTKSKRKPVASAADAVQHDYFDLLDVALVLVGPDGTILRLNSCASGLFGLSARETPGKNIMDIVVPEGEEHQGALKAVLVNIHNLKDQRISFESEVTAGDGSRKWVLWNIRTMAGDGGGAPGGLLLAGTDITGRKQEEDLIKECCERLDNELKAHNTKLLDATSELNHEINERKWVEEVLRKSEEKYRLVVENANDSLTADDLPHLFEPFWQKDDARTAPQHSGVGLALVSAYARLLGASASADLPNPGTLRMTVEIPLRDPNNDA